MKTPSTTTVLLVAAAATTTTSVSGFVVRPRQQQQHHIISSTTATTTSTTALNGLFDGVKEAFSAPPSQLDSERETPIDRWMGWSVVSENAAPNSAEPVGTYEIDVFGCFLLFVGVCRYV
jgi:uncharacterized protein (DUF1778 family)